jgi:hypothetical protein
VSPDDTEESVAMWNLYARAGLLIKTNWKAIQDTLAGQSDYEAGLFSVNYVRVGAHDEKFKRADNLKRPYLFKSRSYKHEQELRIVFSAKGKWLHPGTELRIDPKKLIKWVTFSPYLSVPEFESLKAMLFAGPNQTNGECTSLLPGVVVDHSRHDLEEHMPDSWYVPVHESVVDIPDSIKIL